MGLLVWMIMHSKADKIKTQTERFGQASMQAPRLSEPKEPHYFKQSLRGHQRTTQEQCASDREGKTVLSQEAGR